MREPDLRTTEHIWLTCERGWPWWGGAALFWKLWIVALGVAMVLGGTAMYSFVGWQLAWGRAPYLSGFDLMPVVFVLLAAMLAYAQWQDPESHWISGQMGLMASN